MKRPKKVVTEASQQFTFTRRALFLGAAQGAVGALLAGRMAWISVMENERYSLLSESNRVNLTLIPPRRGWIVDRNGKPIAINRTDFRVDLIPDRVEDKEHVLGVLRTLLQLSDDEVQRIRDDLEESAGFKPVQVAEDLDWEKFAAVSVRLNELPGVSPTRGYSRFYPDGAAVGHLIGYVGAASAKQYEEQKDPLLITPGFKIGKEGVEKVLEPRLRGQPGAKRIEVTARGKLVRELTTRGDVPGNTLKLTIDEPLQLYAARRLGPNSGSAIVIDCETGGILCMASMPSYDPNSFSDGIGRDEWRMLSEDERRPLYNKALQAMYPPGSTFKPIHALAILAAGIGPEETVHCPGGYRLGNRFFRCLGRHGTVNMTRAIAKSCNTYFYAMGRRIGIGRIAEASRIAGLGKKYDLPTPSQNYGTVPDAEWKQRKYKQQWTESDTLNAAIGQGYVLVTPLQLAVAAARIASGRILEPELIAAKAKPGARSLPVPPEFLEAVRVGMTQVVNGDGTAGRSRLPLEGIQMAGKTGTAQVRRIAGGQRGGLGVPWKYRDHGLFVFFAPADKPRYAGAVVVEHGMSGSGAAAPVARDMMTFMFDQKKAMETLESMEKGWGGDIATRMAKEAAAYSAAKQPQAPPVPTSAASPSASPAPVATGVNATAAQAPE
ncbi:penicillin-binding protein 2 [Sphingomonas sp.]|uniref:penicillin-binding protein 2 n=1 Tax=Sphingomonas sp. TaxID=28214 RepID=UPI002DE54FFD|nr:penicillin-binding protein 2 [Sphingomonas sp.]HEV2568181.1 penicillin-binding protein 2 [Sphingomonas sp.]